MSSIEEVINTYIVEDEASARESIARKLAENYTLLKIVISLEDPLTQEDDLVRAKATQCLVDTVQFMNKLSSQEFSVLTAFLSDRLSDLKAVRSAADGLRELAARNTTRFVTNDTFWEKMQAIDMLNLGIEARYAVFRLLNQLSMLPAVLKNATSEDATKFVTTFVGLASGEKDPRNLMISLDISRSILEHLGLNLASEKRAEIYDITFCYFPVKFLPPKDMPYKITAEEIKDSLNRTLSRPELAEWVIPALISKLTAVSITVKLESLAALDGLLQNIAETADLEPYWPQIWDGLKYEILHGTPENDTYQPVIKILQKFTGIPAFIGAIQEVMKGDIPKSKLLQLSHLVVELSQSEEVWQELAPPAVLKSMEHTTVLNLYLGSTHPTPHADQVFQALLQAVATDHKKEGLEGLTKLAKNSMGTDYVPLIVQTLTQEKAYTELAELARTHEKEVRDHALPQLFSELPETLDPLSNICSTRALAQTFAVRLLARLNLADQMGSQSMLQALITSMNHLDSTDFTGFDRGLILPLLQKAADYTGKLDNHLIESMSILLEKSARGVSTSQQDHYGESVLKFQDRVHFHLILSSLAPMQKFYFPTDFVIAHALPKLQASKDILERAAYLRLISLIANKWTDAVGSVDDLNSKLESAAFAAEENVDALEAYTWLSKGLILRADNLGFHNVDALAKRAVTSPLAAGVFGVIAAPDRLLVKENGCTVRPLFRQRLFILVLPQMLEHDTSINSLAVLSALLKYTPQPVVASKFDSILRLLMSSVESDVALLQETAVQSLNASLPTSAATLQTHLHLLVPRLLEIAVSQKSSEQARTGALETIISLKESLPEVMADYGKLLIKGLVPALGDPKRDVRRLAVKARQSFY